MSDKPEYPFNADQLAWLHDLETTTEPQCTGYLYSTGTDMPYGFCCLGRACAVLGLDPKDQGSYCTYDGCDCLIPPSAMSKLRLVGDGGDFRVDADEGSGSLTEMNDDGWSFKQIAAYIRANPWNVFRDPEDAA